MPTVTQTAPTLSITDDLVEHSPVCGQCKFFDASRGMCEGKTVAWEYDRSVAVRPFANSDDEVCNKYSERFPF